jgi:hypothetical protein
MILEIIFSSFFFIDYVWGLYKAKIKKAFLLNWLNFIDLISILPVIVYFLPVKIKNQILNRRIK